jgi:hypothetical protein
MTTRNDFSNFDLPDEHQTEAEHDTDHPSEARPLQGVPWMAVALALHVLMLALAWFILPAQAQQTTTTILQSHTETVMPPPEPEQEPQDESDFPEEKIDPDPESMDDQIVTDPDNIVNIDPSDMPNDELADHDNPEDSLSQSPHPNNNPNSSVGLAGGAGGGPGAGGRGGYFSARATQRGGGPESDHVDAALEWLRDHQNVEGHWSATTFTADSQRVNAERTYNIEMVNVNDPNGDKGYEHVYDPGLTGLAMLAFTGAGYDHRIGKFRNTLRQAVLYLRRIQGNDGCFGPKEDLHYVYNHAICAMAMAELYGLSNDPMLRGPVMRGIEFILNAQNPGLGWRYGTQTGENDTSVTGWMVLTLSIAYKAGLDIDYSKSFAAAAEYLELMTVDVNGYPRTGYLTPGSENARLRSAQGVYDENPSMDSIYVMSMLFMDKADLRDPTIRALAGACIKPDNLPRWELNKLDYYYWYYASLALYQVGGSTWDRWESAMVGTLLNHQRGWHELDRAANRDSAEVFAEHGSWDPIDAWGAAGGRVYATAINCLSLQTYYRHLRVTGD